MLFPLRIVLKALILLYITPPPKDGAVTPYEAPPGEPPKDKDIGAFPESSGKKLWPLFAAATAAAAAGVAALTMLGNGQKTEKVCSIDGRAGTLHVEGADGFTKVYTEYAQVTAGGQTFTTEPVGQTVLDGGFKDIALDRAKETQRERAQGFCERKYTPPGWNGPTR